MNRTPEEETQLLADMMVGQHGYGLEKKTAEELGIQFQAMKDFPAGENVFNHDLYHMGSCVNDNLLVMFDSGNPSYVILVFPKTGKRIRMSLPKELVG